VSDWLIGTGGMFALVMSVIEKLPKVTESGDWLSGVGSVALGSVPGVALLLLSVATKTVGSGDGAVLALLGAAVGFQKSLLVFGVGLFLTALCSVVLLVLRKANRNTCLPFLPFLTVGWFLIQGTW